jgi:hypothetical protein
MVLQHFGRCKVGEASSTKRDMAKKEMKKEGNKWKKAFIEGDGKIASTVKQDTIFLVMGVQFGGRNSKINVKSGEVQLDVQRTRWTLC